MNEFRKSQIQNEMDRLAKELKQLEAPVEERRTVARNFSHALDGLIRSRVSGDGGEEYARKCIDEIADSLEILTRSKATE